MLKNNASSPADVTARINTGSFTYFSSGMLGTPLGCITAIDHTTGSAVTADKEPPQILAMYSSDESAFSYKSVYINGGFNQRDTKIEGFLNGVSTDSVTCTLNPDGGEYGKVFDLSNKDALKNVDEIRITNLGTWYDGDTLPHGNCATFNAFEIGELGAVQSYPSSGFIFMPTCDIVCEDKLYFV